MTAKERTGMRDIKFSNWIREKLPDSNTGYSVSDLDFMLWNWKTKKVMLLEIKCRMVELKPNQYIMIKNIHNWIKKGIDQEWTYLGYNLVMFEGDTFDNGKVYLNRNEISEKDLIQFLSF